MQINSDYIQSGNYIKKTYLGERDVANILLSSNINGEFSICLEDEQNGVKSSWEMIMCEEDAKKVALRLAKITGIVPLDATVNNAMLVEQKKEIVPVCKVTFDKEQLQELVDKAIIRCQDCKHQKKYWHEDKRMKEKGYWIYGCDLIDDSFVGTPVWGADNQFCSSAEAKKNE